MHTLRTLAAAAIAFMMLMQPTLAQETPGTNRGIPCWVYTICGGPQCVPTQQNGACGIYSLKAVSLYDAARVGRMVR